MRAHGVGFELAKTVLKTRLPSSLSMIVRDYGEERYVIIGMSEGHELLFVAYTEREERIRVISARRATNHEQDHYFRQND